MSNDAAKQALIDAITSGRVQPTTIVFGDNVQHKIEKVEAGGIGIQIVHGKEEKGESLYPREGDYKAVVEWLDRQKQKEGIDYLAAANYNRSEMCRKLSEIFGWEVSQNSLRKAEEQKK